MFGIDIIDSGLLLALVIAFFAGALSFISPCVLPIVPPYLAYMAGINIDMMSTHHKYKTKVAIIALFFILGLSTVFLLLAFTASYLGQIFLQNQIWFNRLAGLIVLIFGLHFLGIFKISFLMRELRIEIGNKGANAFGAYLLGLAFAFGWSPCLGPVLSVILSLSAQEASVLRGLLLMIAYIAGLGIPFILSALFLSSSLYAMNALRKYMHWVERIMGGLLVIIGFALLSGRFSSFAFWILEVFPQLAKFG